MSGKIQAPAKIRKAVANDSGQILDLIRMYKFDRNGSGFLIPLDAAEIRGHTELYALIQQQSYGLFRRHGFAYRETPPQKLERDCEKCPQHNDML